MLYQHHHCHVTQPLLHEQLRAWGIDISVGQIDALLSSANDAFLAEKDQLLIAGLEVSRYITVDDSGARHQGNNGYVTQIGNDWFAWFASTASKSRINFLQLLHAGNITYTLNAHALSYLQEERLPKEPLRRLQRQTSATLAGVACWEAHLDALGIEREHHRRIATEGALLGGLIEKGFALDLAIISGGTRSDLGKRCRDGFASLKKTCRKLGISFWDYLGDRIARHGHIAPLPDIIRERAAAASTVP